MTEHEKTTSLHPFSQRLLAWYDEFGRELPWRSTRDPYRIWISEIILQQTRVAQGYDYYLRFIQRFPTVETLAEAPQDEVMRQWEGLGYYSRARNLHAAAQQIVEQGGFPTDYEGVRKLKGVGDYTAAAICSFAYDLPTAVVDGNVYRVLSRFFGIDTPIDSTVGKKDFCSPCPRTHRCPTSCRLQSGDYGLWSFAMRSPRSTMSTLPFERGLRCPRRRHRGFFTHQGQKGGYLASLLRLHLVDGEQGGEEARRIHPFFSLIGHCHWQVVSENSND